MKKIWKALIVVAVVAVVVLIGYFFVHKRTAGRSKQPNYQTAPVTRGTIEVKVLATGTVQPFTRVEFRSPASGRIDSLRVDERDKVKPGDILGWISSTDRTTLMDAARSALELARRGGDTSNLREAEYAYEVANKAYEPVPLITSIAGEIIDRNCQPGQNVILTDVLFVLSDRLVAQAQVDEADIGQIRLHEQASIVLDAFPDIQVAGTVAKISREGTVVSGVVVYNVLVDPIKVPAEWASGMTANVEFTVAKKDDIFIIPKSAVNERNGKKFVQVGNGRFSHPRKIQTGITDGKMIEVTDGLSEGDTVVFGNAGTGNGTTRQQQQSGRPSGPMMMRFH
jgi:macrolide-specific efflux system membrane fusion protein